jgi:hypothetical protein
MVSVENLKSEPLLFFCLSHESFILEALIELIFIALINLNKFIQELFKNLYFLVIALMARFANIRIESDFFD